MKSIRDLFDRTYRPEDGLCFVLMPFRGELQEVYDHVIKPALTGAPINMQCVRGDEIYTDKPIMGDVWAFIQRAEIVIADLTGRNPNVLYELGLCHSLWKRVILISQSIDDVPFDLRHFRVIKYDHTQHGTNLLRKRLVSAVCDIRNLEQPVYPLPGQSGYALEGIRYLVESSELPMHFADRDHVVLFCNAALASLAGSITTSIIGLGVLDLAMLFKDRVPEVYRQRYIDRQVEMSKLSLTQRPPHFQVEEFLDNRNQLVNEEYRHLYRAWIHSDKVIDQEAKLLLGTLVLAKLDKIDSLPE